MLSPPKKKKLDIEINNVLELRRAETTHKNGIQDMFIKKDVNWTSLIQQIVEGMIKNAVPVLSPPVDTLKV